MGENDGEKFVEESLIDTFNIRSVSYNKNSAVKYAKDHAKDALNFRVLMVWEVIVQILFQNVCMQEEYQLIRMESGIQVLSQVHMQEIIG